MDSKGAALTGSEKQIAWAADIRAKMLAMIDADRAAYESMAATYGQIPPAEQYAASARIVAAILGCTSAKALIDARTANVSLWTRAYDADVRGEAVDRLVARLS